MLGWSVPGPGENRFRSDDPAEQGQADEDEVVTLLFRGGGEALKAVPLSLTRLEEIDATKIEWLGGEALVQYRGRLMPLVAADEALAIRRDGKALVVFSDGERMMGLAVDEIVDIVDDKLDIEPSPSARISSARR